LIALPDNYEKPIVEEYSEENSHSQAEDLSSIESSNDYDDDQMIPTRDEKDEFLRRMGKMMVK